MIRQETEISYVARITGGKIHGKSDLLFNSISTDSRNLSVGSGFLFVAISGEHHDGNRFIADVYEKGVRCFLTDQYNDPDDLPGAVFCVVDDSLKALQQLAHERRKQFDGTVVGITGSNGKTIVKEWLYQCVQSYYSVVRSPRSYNSQLGVPLSLWQLRDGYELAIIEAGISEPGEMERLQEIIAPEIGILTNIGTAHSENFESESEKLKEKLILFKNAEMIIYRSDQLVDGEDIESYMEDIQAKKISWANGKEAGYGVKFKNRKEDVLLTISHPENGCELKLPFTDEASVENIVHVVICMLELGIPPAVIGENLLHLEPVEMRLETLKGIYNSTLVNDVYNSDLAGLGVALDVLKQQNHHSQFTVILSDVFQSGLTERELYRMVAKMIKQKGIKRLIGIGHSISGQFELFTKEALFFPDTDSFIQKFSPAEIANQAVLIKGARKFNFERITQHLQSRYHKTVLEINLNHLTDNLNYYRSLVKPGTKLMVMVKAFSYGSGGHEIAHVLQHEKVDYLAVAFADEGIALRKAGVDLPIMVMNSDEKDFRHMIENKLEPEIYSEEVFSSFLKVCRFMGETAYPVHIKLDTGMHRLGFEMQDVNTIREMLSSSEVQVKSVFSHLAGAYDAGFDGFSHQQVSLFNKMVDELKAFIPYDFMVHILNTAGIERFTEYHFDMVRIGIGLYGHGLSSKLKPVTSFKTVVSQLREVKAGDTVGYDRAGLIKKDSIIATIPVGYADGIDRRLGNGAYSFIVNGSPVPTVGNICMDMTMLDVSGFEVRVGDIVELISPNNTVEKMAEQLDTISYEVLTSIPDRVKRIYVRE